LPHRRLAEVFWSRIDTKRDQVSSVDAFLFQTPLTFLGPEYSILLQLAGLALRLCLSPRFESGVAFGIVSGTDA
jgi:hypothetical protein